jgi:hypothetical protein
MTIWPEFFRSAPSTHRSPEDRALLEEPALEDLLDDPVMQTVMRRDGVTRLEILSLMRRFQRLQAAAASLGGPAPRVERPVDPRGMSRSMPRSGAPVTAAVTKR